MRKLISSRNTCVNAGNEIVTDTHERERLNCLTSNDVDDGYIHLCVKRSAFCVRRDVSFILKRTIKFNLRVAFHEDVEYNVPLTLVTLLPYRSFLHHVFDVMLESYTSINTSTSVQIYYALSTFQVIEEHHETFATHQMRETSPSVLAMKQNYMQVGIYICRYEFTYTYLGIYRFVELLRVAAAAAAVAVVRFRNSFSRK